MAIYSLGGFEYKCKNLGKCHNELSEAKKKNLAQ